MTGAGQQPELAWVCGRRGSNPVSHFIDEDSGLVAHRAALFHLYLTNGCWMLGVTMWRRRGASGKKNKP